MADWLEKKPVLSDLLKDEQPRFLGREEGAYDNTAVGAVPVLLGTVVQMNAAGTSLEPWDMSAATPDVDDIYGILLSDVPAGESARVGVLISGPAAIDPGYLNWSSAVQTKIDAGLAALKGKKLIFTREVIADGTYPEQIL
jgi:hypothetical protein